MTLRTFRHVYRVCAMACAALGVMLPMQPFAWPQEPAIQILHLDKEKMSAADLATVRARRAEIIETAELYGYNLMTGNWSYRQTVCKPMPHTILLHYTRRFPDGAESLFTALVPRGQGSVRIVPVLHRNATPYVPAPRNPRNYALFNRLVPSEIAAKELESSRNWIELSACYAEMTGADIEMPDGGSINSGVAGAPTASIQVDSKHRSSLVTFADRETVRTFRVWSISFDRAGRVRAAGTEVYPVSLSPQAPLQPSATAAVAPLTEQVATPIGASLEPTAQPSTSPGPQGAAMNGKSDLPVSSVAATPPAPAQGPAAKASAPVTQSKTSGPGWKFVPQAPQPPVKFIPEAPQPPSKVMPQPPN